MNLEKPKPSLLNPNRSMSINELFMPSQTANLEHADHLDSGSRQNTIKSPSQAIKNQLDRYFMNLSQKFDNFDTKISKRMDKLEEKIEKIQSE